MTSLDDIINQINMVNNMVNNTPTFGTYTSTYETAIGNYNWANGLTINSSVTIPTPIPQEEAVPTETLFEVFVVSKNRRLILREFAVAKDEHGAKFRAGVDSALRNVNLEPDDVTILCRPIGQVEVEKKPQKVQIIKDDPKDGGNG